MNNTKSIKELYLRHTKNLPLSGYYQHFVSEFKNITMYQIGILTIGDSVKITYIDVYNNMYRSSYTSSDEYKYSVILPINKNV